MHSSKLIDQLRRNQVALISLVVAPRWSEIGILGRLVHEIVLFGKQSEGESLPFTDGVLTQIIEYHRVNVQSFTDLGGSLNTSA